MLDWLWKENRQFWCKRRKHFAVKMWIKIILIHVLQFLIPFFRRWNLVWWEFRYRLKMKVKTLVEVLLSREIVICPIVLIDQINLWNGGQQPPYQTIRIDLVSLFSAWSSKHDVLRCNASWSLSSASSWILVVTLNAFDETMRKKLSFSSIISSKWLKVDLNTFYIYQIGIDLRWTIESSATVIITVMLNINNMTAFMIENFFSSLLNVYISRLASFLSVILQFASKQHELCWIEATSH